MILAFRRRFGARPSLRTDDALKRRARGAKHQTVEHMKTPDPEMDDKISVLYLVGYSTYQIARRLGEGLTQDQVRKALRRTNTPMRSNSEAQQLRKAMA